VHDHLIRKSCFEALPCDVRAQDDNIAASGSLLRDGRGLFDAHVQETAAMKPSRLIIVCQSSLPTLELLSMTPLLL